MGKYVYDETGLKFERKRHSPGKIVRTVLKFFVLSVFLAIVYYVVFALFFNTEEEKRLYSLNRLMEEEYVSIEENMSRLDNVIAGLEARDAEIYSRIFNALPENSGWERRFLFLDALDSLSGTDIIAMTHFSIGDAMKASSRVSERLSMLTSLVSAGMPDSLYAIPSVSPIEDFMVSQTGASTGRKINPFYKIMTEHTGLDMLAYAGDKVRAAAPGTVLKTVRGEKGMGNYVVIDHGNGYETLYAHLAEINVRRGKRVGRGDVIGTVGVSGLSFASHLHYEVHKDGSVVDPVHYFFAGQTPRDYIEMARLSAGTGQSLD